MTTNVFHERLPDTRAGVVAMTWTPAGDDYSPACGTVVIDTKKSRTEYRLTEFPTPWRGRGFTFVKADGSGERYSVFCSAHGPAGDSCDCPSGCYRPGTPCRHRNAVRALILNRWL